jgi:hypothetical protein
VPDPTTLRDQLETDVHHLDLTLYEAERNHRSAAELAELYTDRARLWRHVATAYPADSEEQSASVTAALCDEQEARRLTRLANR